MIRVHVICEGQTEEMFVKELLAGQFQSKGVYLTPSLIGKPGHKGGNVRFDRLRIDVRNLLLHDKTAYCTTFVDFYGLPADFPGKTEALKFFSIEEKAQCVRMAMTKELEPFLNSTDGMRRFIPYVQMYEFESLLFSSPDSLANGISRPGLSVHFQKIRDLFNSPEMINDNPATAPSKRIKKVAPGYEKPLYGALAALEIGLDVMRRECQLFDSWLNQIERFGQEKTES